MSPDSYHLMAALRALHQSIEDLRRELDELRDEVKVMNPMQFIVGEEDSETESVASVQSAPATFSLEREGDD